LAAGKRALMVDSGKNLGIKGGFARAVEGEQKEEVQCSERGERRAYKPCVFFRRVVQSTGSD